MIQLNYNVLPKAQLKPETEHEAVKRRAVYLQGILEIVV